MEARLDPGFDLYRNTVRDRAAAVAERGAWRLTLTSDPFEAVALLDEAASELARTE